MALASSKTEDSETPAEYHKITANNEIAMDDYIDSIAWVGRLSGSDKPVIIVIKNALCTNGLTLTMQDMADRTPVRLALRMEQASKVHSRSSPRYRRRTEKAARQAMAEAAAARVPVNPRCSETGADSTFTVRALSVLLALMAETEQTAALSFQCEVISWTRHKNSLTANIPVCKSRRPSLRGWSCGAIPSWRWRTWEDGLAEILPTTPDFLLNKLLTNAGR